MERDGDDGDLLDAGASCRPDRQTDINGSQTENKAKFGSAHRWIVVAAGVSVLVCGAIAFTATMKASSSFRRISHVHLCRRVHDVSMKCPSHSVPSTAVGAALVHGSHSINRPVGFEDCVLALQNNVKKRTKMSPLDRLFSTMLGATFSLHFFIALPLLAVGCGWLIPKSARRSSPRSLFDPSTVLWCCSVVSSGVAGIVSLLLGLALSSVSFTIQAMLHRGGTTGWQPAMLAELELGTLTSCSRIENSCVDTAVCMFLSDCASDGAGRLLEIGLPLATTGLVALLASSFIALARRSMTGQASFDYDVGREWRWRGGGDWRG